MARDYAERAKWLVKEAENALNAENALICVRRTQEALELSAKAALRRLAIEYPRDHDVSEALGAASERLPNEIREKLPETMTLLAELARIRGPAFYGYEQEGIPASEAFTREYAANTFRRSKPIVELLARFASGGS